MYGGGEVEAFGACALRGARSRACKAAWCSHARLQSCVVLARALAKLRGARSRARKAAWCSLARLQSCVVLARALAKLHGARSHARLQSCVVPAHTRSGTQKQIDALNKMMAEPDNTLDQ